MATPSVKTLQTRLNLDKDRALQLRKVLDGRLDPESFETVKRWVGQCFHKPRSMELIMAAADEILGTHGVEAIQGEEWGSAYYGSVRMSYCNTGDSYGATLIRDHVKGRWIVGSWGDIVERDPAFRGEV